MSGFALAPEKRLASTSAAPSRILQRKCAGGGSRTSCAACNEEDRALQRRLVTQGQGAFGEAPRIVHEVLDTPGEPLREAERMSFESDFRHDFSGVRVHADSKAAASARAVQAEAYTVGSDIVFAAGKWNGAADNGLLAHELAHVVQQSATISPRSGPIVLSAPGDAAEKEADAMANRPSPPLLRVDLGLFRKAAEENSTSEVVSEEEVEEVNSLKLQPTVTLDRFRNSGSKDAENECSRCNPNLGVSTKHGINSMEIRGTVKNHQLAAVYDIRRISESVIWAKTYGMWTRNDKSLPGSLDDSTNIDEDLIPMNGHIFSTDSPGYHLDEIPDVKGATEVVFKGSYEEYATVQMGKSAPVTQAKTVKWHSVSRYWRKPNESWKMIPELCEIDLGSISMTL